MFATTVTSESDFDKVILKDEITGTIVEIIPSCGAILNAFKVFNNGTLLNVIDGYDNTADFKTNAESKGFRSAKLSPFACRIKNSTYTFKEQQYTVEKFILNGSAIHGLLYDVAFKIIATTADEEKATVSLQYDYTGSDNGYPFKYTCIIVYTLTVNNSLTLVTTITNNDKAAIPMQDGWHPYFKFGNSIDELQLEFQSKEIVEFDDALIPTGKLKPYEEFGALKKIEGAEFDNCFTLNFTECQPLCVLRDKTKKLQLEIRPDKTYPYLQIYTPPHRKSIAIENLSAIPDAFNNGVGLQIVEPGASISFTTTYTITSLP